MTSEPTPPPVIGAIAEDRAGTTLGIVAEIYADRTTGQTTWLAITAGLHSDTTILAPAAGAVSSTGRVRLPLDATTWSTAPPTPTGRGLLPDEEAALHTHYASDVPTRQAADAAVQPASPAAQESGAMTRSEERLTVRTEVVPTRRAVLRVETTSEQVMVPVTITRQHAYVDYVDIDPADATPVDPALLLNGAATAWSVLTADEPVVTTRPVPVERVRLVTNWVAQQHTVQTQLAHEELAQDFMPAPAEQSTLQPTRSPHVWPADPQR
jgi:stress response protein YsnF